MQSPIITFMPVQTIVSPCVNVCSIDPSVDTDQGGRCEGCHRTLAEIGRWTDMTPAERDRIMAELKDR